MKSSLSSSHSLGEVHSSVDTTVAMSPRRRILAFLGPAYLVSVGYMDPGNWETDLAGGSRFGYTLIWVLLMSNLMALVLQNLSARLGIVRGRDLAQVNREVYPRAVNFILYIMAEIAIAACDLAEVLGMAVGIHLLTHIPIIWGVMITICDTFILLYVQKLGIRKMEAFIISLVGIIGLSFLVELIFAKPDLGEVVKGFIPSLPGKQALFISIGIIGATVMPHNLYLHSALVQTRKFPRTDKGIRQALKINFLDSSIALNLAFFVNAAILVLAATVFHKTGLTEVAQIKDAYKLLSPRLGNNLAPVIFAIALIAAGQSSTITGTLAGQIVMEGYLLLRINPWIRRLLTRLLAIIPALAVLLIYGEEKIDALLVLSQVILSIQLGFAIIPLIFFVSDRSRMGKFAAPAYIQVLAWVVAGVLIYLNLRMLFGEAIGYLQNQPTAPMSILILLGLAAMMVLFTLVIAIPLLQRKKADRERGVHREVQPLGNIEIPRFSRIAITLDFGKYDQKVISYALGQGGPGSQFLLLHVVESATARMLGPTTDDFETRRDQEQLDDYARHLSAQGYQVATSLGYRHRVEEIVRIVREEEADLLVMGAHGHTGVKDILYGDTINKVRHELKIPVLVVSL
jgi:manganese transport protein